MDASDKEEIRGFVRDAVGEAIAPLASDLALLRGEVHEVRERQTSFAEEQAKLATSLTQVAGAAAHAANIGLEAKMGLSEVQDVATKIVQSALAIHNASIASTVEATVTKAVEPLSTKFTQLETNDKNQEATLAAQNDTLEAQNKTLANLEKMLTSVVAALGNPTFRRALIIAAVLGAIMGGAVAGYMGVQGKDTVKHILP